MALSNAKPIQDQKKIMTPSGMSNSGAFALGRSLYDDSTSIASSNAPSRTSHSMSATKKSSSKSPAKGAFVDDATSVSSRQSYRSGVGSKLKKTMENKVLVIERRFRNEYGEVFTETELVRDPVVIMAYLKHKEMKKATTGTSAAASSISPLETAGAKKHKGFQDTFENLSVSTGKKAVSEPA